MAIAASIEQLRTLPIFASLSTSDLVRLQPASRVIKVARDEIVFHQSETLLPCLYVVLSGTIQISRASASGKETILRSLTTGEIFAAPALLGDCVAPATVTAETPVEILTIEKDALVAAIQGHPEIALTMLATLNQRLQQLHDRVHGLVSERAIARLAQHLCASASQGVTASADGDILTARLSYYHIARSIGITYEECVRLFKQLNGVAHYSRGGVITVAQWDALRAIATGLSDP